MARRARLNKEKKEEKPSLYFDNEDKQPVNVFSTGCTLLDCVLGGGFVFGRISNIIGDNSTGKTLLAIEATANFIRKFPDSYIVYAEAEAAFDEAYALSLGMPIDKVRFSEVFTVEDFYNDLKETCKKAKELEVPALYIVDSLDALSDVAEQEREFSDTTMGMSKAKKLSELFRRIVKEMKGSNVTLIVISQTRQNISPGFGVSYTVSGGSALRFYCTHRIYLAHIKTLKQTRNKIQRPIGIEIRAKCIKNKLDNPFRECDFPLIFGFGVDDVKANIEWLDSSGFLNEYDPETSTRNALLNKIVDMEDKDYFAEMEKLRKFVMQKWKEIELEFAPGRSKYKEV